MKDVAYNRIRESARRIYTAASMIHSPYFGGDVVLGPEGFQHLQHSEQGTRSRKEQIQRFILLPLGLKVLRTATTVQEYRRALMPLGPSAKRAGSPHTIAAQWWGFVAAFVARGVIVRVVVRKVGSGKIHFWSLMRYRDPNRSRRGRMRRRRT